MGFLFLAGGKKLSAVAAAAAVRADVIPARAGVRQGLARADGSEAVRRGGLRAVRLPAVSMILPKRFAEPDFSAQKLAAAVGPSERTRLGSARPSRSATCVVDERFPSDHHGIRSNLEQHYRAVATARRAWLNH